jgi:hypothetical protein
VENVLRATNGKHEEELEKAKSLEVLRSRLLSVTAKKLAREVRVAGKERVKQR